jgi:hypothetical protein
MIASLAAKGCSVKLVTWPSPLSLVPSINQSTELIQQIDHTFDRSR